MDQRFIRKWDILWLIIHYDKYSGISIESCDRVYRPAEDTFLIMDHIVPGNKVLEIGCGTGIISVYCAVLGRDVTCCDVSPDARVCAEKNAIRNHVELKIIDSQLFNKIEGKFDTIVFNPPYLPSEDRYEDSGQWDGGKDGFDHTRPFLKAAQHFLNDGGSIYIILTSLTDVDSLIREFDQYTFKLKVEQSFFFETIYLYQAFPKPGSPDGQE